MSDVDVRGNVEKYYGDELKSSSDLKTSACCSIESIPDHHKEILSLIEDEVLSRFYGCGSPIPPSVEGCKVLDLGCGTGRDVYLLSKLVGEQGHVIGVDMTEDQLAVARKHEPAQMEKFGYKKSNVTFKKGLIEDLKSLDIEDNSIDIIVSNCVINLSVDKEKVFSEIYRVLKPGGELYFSDVFSDRRIPSSLAEDHVLVGECLGGAMYHEDFRRAMEKIGFLDFRVTHKAPIALDDPNVEAMAGMIKFSSLTIRAFKLEDTLEDRCEDYGQMAVYKGTDKYHPHRFILDDHHVFEKGKPLAICGNTASMLEDTRLKKHFNVVGNRETHYGFFNCSSDIVSSDVEETGTCC